MHTDHFDVNAFASDTNQAFVKDEIRGDGTSGLYHLSRKNIVVNSDKITIEVRDRFRSEIVLSSQPLTRFVDYDIDYDTGALFFKQPIMSKDENFNPVYIVVDYESDDGGQDLSYTYGGRAAVKTVDDRVEAGATAIHEGQTGGSGNLYGLDATWKITDSTEVHAEAATSKTACRRGGPQRQRLAGRNHPPRQPPDRQRLLPRTADRASAWASRAAAKPAPGNSG